MKTLFIAIALFVYTAAGALASSVVNPVFGGIFDCAESLASRPVTELARGRPAYFLTSPNVNYNKASETISLSVVVNYARCVLRDGKPTLVPADPELPYFSETPKIPEGVAKYEARVTERSLLILPFTAKAGRHAKMLKLGTGLYLVQEEFWLYDSADPSAISASRAAMDLLPITMELNDFAYVHLTVDGVPDSFKQPSVGTTAVLQAELNLAKGGAKVRSLRQK